MSSNVGSHSLVGVIGRVTVPIPATGPGEVLLPVRGGSEAFTALADEAIPKHRPIMVIQVLTARCVLVAPQP